MQDEIAVLKLVVGRLESAGLPYMVSGSVALNFYAQPRMTRDIDLVVELAPADTSRFIELFQQDFYCDPDSIRDAAQRRGMFNLVHFEKVVKLDFIVRKDTPFRREELARRRRIEVDGSSLWVVSPEDLVLSKLFWAKDSHSDFQLRDVRNLLVSAGAIDWSYLEHWATELGVAELLAEVHG